MDIPEYNSDQYKLSLINNTNLKIENVLNTYLFNRQSNICYHYIQNESQLLNNLTYAGNFKLKNILVSHLKKNCSNQGLVINKWINKEQNDVVLLYNDSALLSLPYLLNIVTNFYSSLDNISLINTNLSSLPKIAEDSYKIFEANSFTSLIIVSIGFILPAVSFAAEIVHDNEVI